MTEVWLRANQKPFKPVLSALLIGAAAAVCGWLAIGVTSGTAGATACWVTALFCTLAATALWYVSRKPRIAFDGRSVLFFVRFGPPVAVPIELVEAFLIGRGPTFLPGRDHDPTETATIVVRIAERAEEFNKVETAAMLAGWCGHYVTLRGTWTEPLGLDVVNRLNQRLYDVQQAATATTRGAS